MNPVAKSYMKIAKKNLPLSPILTHRKLAHIVVGTGFMGSIVNCQEVEKNKLALKQQHGTFGTLALNMFS
jgi:hypothetical protein